MGGRQGTANGIARGPGGVTAPAYYTAAALAAADDGYPKAEVTKIANRAYAAGMSAPSAKALVKAAQAGNARSVNAVLDAFPASLGGLNLGTSVTSAVDGTMTVRSSFTNKSGDDVGHMTRVFHPNSGPVYHSFFELKSSVKGQGAGYKIFKHQIDAYTRNGLERLSVSAAGGGGYNGGYTWGRFGYRFSDQSQRGNAVHYFDSYMRRSGVPDKQRERVMKKLDPNTARPGDIARVVATVNGKAHHLGKEFMQERSWNGAFDLRKGSADRRYMNAYPKVSKAIRAQTGAE